jgi:hypothetical protein
MAVLLAFVACEGNKEPAPVSPAPSPGPSVVATPPRLPAPIRRFEFDDVAAGALPAGWTAAEGRWEVSEQKSLRQLAENPIQVFNLLLADAKARDLVLRVRIRSISGKIDQGGGLVWRAADRKNYYVARYNPLEKNFRVYTVKQGKRTQLASADADLPGEVWHTLEIRMHGDRFEGRIDGKPLLQVTDSTFSSAGAIGLWTKADAVTEFDALELDTQD